MSVKNAKKAFFDAIFVERFGQRCLGWGLIYSHEFDKIAKILS